jgi:hypothetical protein
LDQAAQIQMKLLPSVAPTRGRFGQDRGRLASRG